MSRILLLMIMAGWLAGDSSRPEPLAMGYIQRLLLIFGGFGLIVLIPALWSRVAARYVAIANLHRSLNRYNLVAMIARILIPVWFGVCVFGLGWVQVVHAGLGPISGWPVVLPAAIVGTLPAFIAWSAMWWASYPADRALREQSMLLKLQDDLPIHTPPSFWNYFGANLRMQLLFLVVPVAMILLLRDITSLIVTYGFGQSAGPRGSSIDGAEQWWLMPLAVAAMFILAPEILRRVLQTERLPSSPLRERLEAIARRANLRYRDILLWRTGNNMGNAVVMGVLPQVRYILLSDLLLQTMTDRQIEAVFAHEAGHVAHRHIAWYGVFVVVAMVVMVMLGEMATMLNIDLSRVPNWLRDPILLAGSVAMFFLMFGLLSRCFERQADVFAARTMEQELADPARRDEPPARTAVGRDGAHVFASALHRVAIVNNIPIRAPNLSHGSIARRMMYLRQLSLDPANTARFDRFMTTVYRCLIAAFIVCVLWLAWMIAG